MDNSRYIAKHVINLPKSGIRDFFVIVSKMNDVISLGIGGLSKLIAANHRLH